jgi:putative aldouronate transport system permease protein
VFNYIFLFLVALAMALPFIYVIAGSFTSQEELVQRRIVLIPVKPTLAAYRLISMSRMILTGMSSSVLITVVGTLINIGMTTLMAYPLSRKQLMGRSLIQKMIIFTMLFHAGMIPNYMLVRAVGLIDSYWSLWLPIAISAFNLILMRNFFQQIPEEIQEAATVDGCNDLQILWRIVLPLSKPAIAAFSLFYAVDHWNAYFKAIMYINTPEKWPIQVWLRQIIILAQSDFAAEVSAEILLEAPPETVKLAVIVVACIPIMLVYPFLQKHFTKGILLGSVKG